jgi:hypothetical protein
LVIVRTTQNISVQRVGVLVCHLAVRVGREAQSV